MLDWRISKVDCWCVAFGAGGLRLSAKVFVSRPRANEARSCLVERVVAWSGRQAESLCSLVRAGEILSRALFLIRLCQLQLFLAGYLWKPE